MNQITAQQGPLPPPTGEVLVERASLRYLDVMPGDTLRLTTGDGQMAALRVAGVAHDPWQQAADIVRAGFGYADAATLRGLGGARRLCCSLRRMAPVSTLSTVSALAIGILGVRAMMARAHGESIQMFAFDVSADLERAAPVETLRDVAAATAEVARLEPVSLVGGQLADGSDREAIALWGVAPSTATVRPTLLAGRWLREDDTNAAEPSHPGAAPAAAGARL